MGSGGLETATAHASDPYADYFARIDAEFVMEHGYRSGLATGPHAVLTGEAAERKILESRMAWAMAPDSNDPELNAAERRRRRESIVDSVRRRADRMRVIADRSAEGSEAGEERSGGSQANAEHAQRPAQTVAPSGRASSQPPQPSDPAIQREAEALLRDPKLLDRLLAHISRSGLVGEREGARLILLAGVSGLLDEPIHLIVKGPSSAGKNNLVRAALSVLPSKAVTYTSHISSKALSYSSRPIRGVLVIDEAEGQQAAEYSLRIAMSEGRVGNFTLVQGDDGKWMQKHTEVEVSASIITTTTASALHAENQTRVFDVEVDASRQQTESVIRDMAARAEGKRSKPSARETKIVRTALGLLGSEKEPPLVPFARALARAFPTDRVRARRDFPRTLCLIQASVLLHQRQREREGHGRLLATLDDYRNVRPILQAVLQPSMSGLGDMARKLCELRDEVAADLPGQDWVARSELVRQAEARGIATHNTVRSWAEKLCEVGVWQGEQIGFSDAWQYRKLRDPGRSVSLPTAEELSDVV